MTIGRTGSTRLLLCAVALALGCGDSGSTPAVTQPNIVLIMADDLGFGDLSLTGHPRIRTPTIDRLATDGALFSQFYTSGSVCSPTRAGVLTGRYQQRAGIHGIISVFDEELGIGADEVLLPEVLQELGYATGLVGKWHLGVDPHFSPLRNGFDEFVGFLAGHIDYYTHHDTLERADLWRGEIAIEDPRYVTQLIDDESVSFINAHHNEPFFLFVSHATPHIPYQPPGETPRQVYPDGSRFFRGPGSPDVYAAMVESLDRSVERIITALADRGILERTLLVFLSDNGPVGFGSSGPLRGAKGGFFEGGIRTPMMMVWPGRVPHGRVVETPAISIDLFATFVEAARGELPTDRVIDGRSLLPLVGEDDSAQHHEALFWRQGAPDIEGDLAIRRGDWKLVINREGRSLFDLENDPGEQTDLSSSSPAVAAELESLLRAWETDVLASGVAQ